MISSHHRKIRNNSPLLHKIREKGYTPVDMHIHTHHSDAAISIPSLLHRAKHLGMGVAITAIAGASPAGCSIGPLGC